MDSLETTADKMKIFIYTKKKQGWAVMPSEIDCGFIRKNGQVQVYAMVSAEVKCVSIKSDSIDTIIPRLQFPDLYRSIDKIKQELETAPPQIPPPPKPSPSATCEEGCDACAHPGGPYLHVRLEPPKPAPEVARRAPLPATLGDRALQAAKAATEVDAETAAKVLATGNLELLSPVQKVQYYTAVCKSLGLNPLTRPFEYITFWRDKSKITQLYAKRDCTDQLRAIHNISIELVDRRTENGIYIVTAKATTPDGRTDVSTGAKSLTGSNRNGETWQIKGDALANAMMAVETKSKRRVTLSICGLGFLDETEVATIPNATISGT